MALGLEKRNEPLQWQAQKSGNIIGDRVERLGPQRIDKMNEKIMLNMGFAKEVARVHAGLCPFCAEPIGEFKDALSIKEYTISGLCQNCQDKIFSSTEDGE